MLHPYNLKKNNNLSSVLIIHTWLIHQKPFRAQTLTLQINALFPVGALLGRVYGRIFLATIKIC